jgi:hypothetical protein
MSQTSESGTVQVKRFAPEADTTPYAVLLIIGAAGLLFALVLAQVELYAYYKYILFFKIGG